MKTINIATVMAGLSFIGIGFSIRKQNGKSWAVFICGGAILVLISVIAMIFGFSL